jgi:hypothetical protein
MHNPWKLTTLILAAALAITSARAESTNWKKDALSHLQAAASILSSNGGSETGKPPGGEPPKKGGTTAMDKALQLTRAAIVQLKNAGANAD